MTKDEAMVLEEAVKSYPVTIDELRSALRLRPTAFDMALRGLVMKGLVQLEPLEDKTYVRPMASLGPGPDPLPRDEDDPAFM